MLEFFVALHSVADVKQFVSAASLSAVDIDVISGRYTVDAKSILGLCSLDLDKPVQVRVYGDASDGAEFRASVDKMIVDAPEA
jgi:phosphotransferase system HPr-like phosphotransfer protein